ncbi:MAG: DUF1643 domain-containing protein [Opitutaceae bacterium]
MSTCKNSECGRFRYTLEHVMEPDLPLRQVMWIGLHPSLIDDVSRDPTLRRIEAFSLRLGYTAFVVTNLFAMRTSRPLELVSAEDPIGPENDAVLRSMAKSSEAIVACWGSNGALRKREDRVTAMLRNVTSKPMQSLSRNGDGSPKHPLYVRWDTVLTAYPWQTKSNVA